MIGSDGVTQQIAGEAFTLRRLVERAMVGDAYAIETLNEELAAWIAYRDECRDAGHDTGMLDVAITQAERVVGVPVSGIVQASGGVFLPQGLRIGSVVIPWVGVIALCLLIYAALRDRSRSRTTASAA